MLPPGVYTSSILPSFGTDNIVDPDQYLPDATMKFCLQRLSSAGLRAEDVHSLNARLPDGTPVHRVGYFFLRQQISEHITKGNADGLALCEKPTDAYRWSAHTEEEIPEVLFAGEDEDTAPEETAWGEDEMYREWSDLIASGGSDNPDYDD